MHNGKIGIGGVILIVVIASGRVYNILDRRGYFDPAPPPPPIGSPLHPDYEADRQRELASQAEQRERGFALRNQQLDARLDAQSDSLLQQSQRRLQAQMERDLQMNAQRREFLERAKRASTPKPPIIVVSPTPRVDRTAIRTPVPNRPSIPGRTTIDRPSITPQPTQPAAVETEPVEIAIEPYTYSPKPDDALLERYKTWQADGSYDRFLGEAYEFGDWRFKPSSEFKFQRSNARTAKWGVGKAGLGLDADIFKLYPRDKGMACPVHEDTKTKQVFRLGRREIRAKGDAEISHLESNGLMIWRIHTPAQEGQKYGSCYYMAVLGEEDAILFTARYDAKKPEQIAAFDAVVQTLEYVKNYRGRLRRSVRRLET